MEQRQCKQMVASLEGLADRRAVRCVARDDAPTQGRRWRAARVGKAQRAHAKCRVSSPKILSRFNTFVYRKKGYVEID